jgi:hypothetical protein
MKQRLSTAQWEAELNTDVCDPYTNAELTIQLRLGFRQINPAGGAAEGTYHDYGDSTEPNRRIIRWTPGAWARWTQSMVASAQSYWHGRFWLINNFPVLEYDVRGTRYRPNVWCRFTATATTIDPAIYGPWDVHHIIDVVRLHQSENWFGSHSTLYDSRDTESVRKARDSRGRAIMQRAHVHEVGHLLGLGHVDEGQPHCPIGGNTNAAACYGIADDDMRNVMGSGMALTADLAKPWRRAMVQLTGRGNADTPTDWQSKLNRHYPRTSAEITANRSITSRPSRP